MPPSKELIKAPGLLTGKQEGVFPGLGGVYCERIVVSKFLEVLLLGVTGFILQKEKTAAENF